MRVILLILTLLLPACGVESPALAAGRAGFYPMQIGDNSYRVYTEATRNCVEVHRVNFVFPPPSRRQILMEMQEAAEQATQCRLEKGSFIGDQAISKGRLDCSNGPGAKDWVKGSCDTRPWTRLFDPNPPDS